MYAEQGTLFDLEEIYRPLRPLCSNQKDGTYRRRAKEEALHYAYIETNPLCVQSLIVADVDYGNYWDYEDKEIPAPSWRTFTHFNDSYHAVWVLRDPVCLTDAARRPPVNLLARVEAGLRRAVQADESYGGRITKNPLHPMHTTTWGINDECDENNLLAYTLRELAQSLDYAHLLPKIYEKEAIKESAVGRNVELFDITRNWAYRAVKRYWGENYSDWEETVLAYAYNKNLGTIANTWGTPLPRTEVKHLARSIAKWVWQKFTPERLSAIQSYRGKKSAEKRWENSPQSLVNILENFGLTEK